MERPAPLTRRPWVGEFFVPSPPRFWGTGVAKKQAHAQTRTHKPDRPRWLRQALAAAALSLWGGGNLGVVVSLRGLDPAN